MAELLASSATCTTPINTPSIIERFQQLDKWKHPIQFDGGTDVIPQRFVYQHNRLKAAASGFPSSLEIGLSRLGLKDQEVAAIFGWTTGDYRFLNPIARDEQKSVVEFEAYPFLPNQRTKVTFCLSREEVMPYIQVFQSALSKLPPLQQHSSKQPQIFLLWRGHRRPIPTQIGTIVVLPGFSSVSRDRENALGFLQETGRSSKRTLLCFVEHSSSRCLTQLSARRDEMEVLFPCNSTFEVVSAPLERFEEDQRAVQQATERMRTSGGGMSDGEIELVYLKEIIYLKELKRDDHQGLTRDI